MNSVLLWEPERHGNVRGVLMNASRFGVKRVVMYKPSFLTKGLQRTANQYGVALYETNTRANFSSPNTRFVVVEQDGDELLTDFAHPTPPTCYVFGPESGKVPDLGVDRVRIQSKGFLNLSTAVAITLHDRMVK